MNTINQNYESSFRERGSKFMGFFFPCDSEEAFSRNLDQLKSKYPDATHHCYAWRLNPNNLSEFSSDDGEPSGSAGLPILNQLKSFEVVNAGAVVVRYYGGTKLGKAGLIEAYGAAAFQCLESAQLVPVISVQIFEITYPYPEENFINKLKSKYDLTVLESEYLQTVKLKIACPKPVAVGFGNEVAQAEHLGIGCSRLEENFLKKYNFNKSQK